LAFWLKMCQIREVVNQGLLPLVDADAQECCAPLAADPMRLRLLSLIACHDGGESCVCDLLEAFDVTAPSISYHLKILREAGLISSERRGTWVYYRVNPDVLTRMSAVLAPGISGLGRMPGEA
jgi:ArsR family transcriptional regulator, arsenate/arsenite/antimonite-responsive transcriptional repressor